MVENSKNTDINFYEVHSDTGLDSIKNNPDYPDYESSFIHLHKVNEDKEVIEDNLYIGDCRMTDNFNTRNVPDKAKTMKVGGLEPTTIEELKRMSLSEIVMQIVCPKTPPEPPKSKPSMIISYSGEKLIGVGTILPTKINITCSYDKGKWSDGTDYAGEHTNEEISMIPDKWGETSEEGKYVISGSVDFGEGEIPKDSYGNNWEEGLYKGGHVQSNNITITSVYPIQVNTEKIGIMTNQILIDYISKKDAVLRVTVPPEEDGNLNKFKIYLPYAFKPFEINQYNPVSGKYDIRIKMEEYNEDDIPQGYVGYIRTKDIKNTNTGSAEYEIKLTR